MSSCPTSLRRSVFVLGAAFALAFISSCGDVTHVGHNNPPVGPDIFVELEPNDFPETADFVGFVDDLSYLVVQGSVEAVGFDIVDHIEFEATMPIELDFYLDGLGPFADVDVTIYDPIDDIILGTYAISGDESGTIVVHEAGRPFQFIVEAFGEASDWDLELVGYPYNCNCFGDGPESAAQAKPLAGSEGSATDAVSKEDTGHDWIQVLPAS